MKEEEQENLFLNGYIIIMEGRLEQQNSVSSYKYAATGLQNTHEILCKIFP